MNCSLTIKTKPSCERVSVAQRLGQHLAEGLVPPAALHHVGLLVGSLHDALPRPVHVLEPLGLLDEENTDMRLCLTRQETLEL